MNQPSVPVSGHAPTKLLNKYFLVITAVSTISGLTMQLFNTSMSLYVDELGGNASYTGILVLLFAITATLVRIFTGRLADVRGRRVMVIAGLAIYMAASLSFAFFPYLGALPYLRMLQGAGYSISFTALSVAITDVIPRKRMGEGMGYFGLGNAVTTATGPMIALALIAGGSFNNVFYVAALSLAVGTLLMYLFNYEKAMNLQFGGAARQADLQPGRDTPQGSMKTRLWSLFEKSAIPYTVVSVLSSVAMSATLSFLMLFAAGQGIRNAGLYFTFSAVFMVLARLLTGRLSDRHGTLFALIPGFLLVIAGFACLLLSVKIPLLYYLGGVLAGLGNGMASPALNAAVIRAAPDHRRGAASATFMLSYDIGFGLGAILWGVVIDLAGFTALFAGCMISIALAVLFSIIFIRKNDGVQAR